jgi:hypothetical protein
MNLNLDQVDHVTLDLMVNQPQYERYLRAKEADLNGKFEKAKRFYKKRIMEMARDLLKGETTNDIFVLQAFDAFAKACITHFRNKDKNDALQEEHLAIGHLPPIVEECADHDDDDDDGNDYDGNDDGNDGNGNDGNGNGNGNGNGALDQLSKRKLEILLSFDKHKSHTPTLDTYVIKTTPAASTRSNHVPIPQLKEINLDDPKFKTKDLKPKPSKHKSKSPQDSQNE